MVHENIMKNFNYSAINTIGNIKEKVWLSGYYIAKIIASVGIFCFIQAHTHITAFFPLHTAWRVTPFLQ